ncbi:MAG: putative metallo-beta-lactamase family protein [Rhodocyclales bacterium]|nr:putative metallo-beta-lactamase family protein [Rhodocyclales bacterium]
MAPGVRWLCMPLPFSLNHINLWLLGEGEQCVLVDTGLGDAVTRGIWSEFFVGFERSGERLEQIVLTHYHPDHAGNAEWLAREHAVPVWMSTAEYLLGHALLTETAGYDMPNMVAHFRRHGLDEARCEQFIKRGNVYAKGVPALPREYRRLIDGDHVTLAGRPWEVIMGYGHSPEHAALYCSELRLLIAGDMLLPRITTNVNVPATTPEEDSVMRFLQSVRRFARLPSDTLVLPSHGLPFRGVHERITQLQVHHAERDALLAEHLSQPRCATDLLPVLFLRELDMHQLMFALSETIAHLNHLVHRGRAQRLVGADGVIRFVSPH